jgi:hypothetical protein
VGLAPPKCGNLGNDLEKIRPGLIAVMVRMIAHAAKGAVIDHEQGQFGSPRALDLRRLGIGFELARLPQSKTLRKIERFMGGFDLPIGTRIAAIHPAGRRCCAALKFEPSGSSAIVQKVACRSTAAFLTLNLEP